MKCCDPVYVDGWRVVIAKLLAKAGMHRACNAWIDHIIAEAIRRKS